MGGDASVEDARFEHGGIDIDNSPKRCLKISRAALGGVSASRRAAARAQTAGARVWAFFIPSASALETSPQRRAANLRRLLHHDEASALKMANYALSRDGGHVFVGLMDAPAAVESERKGDSVGEVARVGGSELIVGGHGARH
jgi:hypothetical protein